MFPGSDDDLEMEEENMTVIVTQPEIIWMERKIVTQRWGGRAQSQSQRGIRIMTQESTEE